VTIHIPPAIGHKLLLYRHRSRRHRRALCRRLCRTRRRNGIFKPPTTARIYRRRSWAVCRRLCRTKSRRHRRAGCGRLCWTHSWHHSWGIRREATRTCTRRKSRVIRWCKTWASGWQECRDIGRLLGRNQRWAAARRPRWKVRRMPRSDHRWARTPIVGTCVLVKSRLEGFVVKRIERREGLDTNRRGWHRGWDHTGQH
jgi:hypothetical protein